MISTCIGNSREPVIIITRTYCHKSKHTENVWIFIQNGSARIQRISNRVFVFPSASADDCACMCLVYALSVSTEVGKPLEINTYVRVFRELTT